MLPRRDRDYRQQLGRNLRAVIDALGLSYAEAARRMGVEPSKLGNWLRGDNYPDPRIIAQFCTDHGVTTDAIYRGVLAGLKDEIAAEIIANRHTK